MSLYTYRGEVVSKNADVAYPGPGGALNAIMLDRGVTGHSPFPTIDEMQARSMIVAPTPPTPKSNRLTPPVTRKVKWRSKSGPLGGAERFGLKSRTILSPNALRTTLT